jgi:hypothetical protein
MYIGELALWLGWAILYGSIPVLIGVAVLGASEASYESSVVEAFGNLRSSPAYLSPAFLKAEPSSMNFRC